MARLIASLIVMALALTGVGCSGCATALLEGVLVADGAGGMAVKTTEGNAVPVLWPGDIHVRKDGDQTVLANQLDFVVAHEGEFVRLGGGSATDGPGFAACGPIAVRPSPTTR
jgi:hypothetical protein